VTDSASTITLLRSNPAQIISASVTSTSTLTVVRRNVPSEEYVRVSVTFTRSSTDGAGPGR
jgi:hypothetical protein